MSARAAVPVCRRGGPLCQDASGQANGDLEHRLGRSEASAPGAACWIAIAACTTARRRERRRSSGTDGAWRARSRCTVRDESGSGRCPPPRDASSGPGSSLLRAAAEVTLSTAQTGREQLPHLTSRSRPGSTRHRDAGATAASRAGYRGRSPAHPAVSATLENTRSSSQSAGGSPSLSSRRPSARMPANRAARGDWDTRALSAETHCQSRPGHGRNRSARSD